MTKILIVDDHLIVRKGLLQILDEAGIPFEIGEAENGAEAMRKIRQQTWDIVLLDIAMPGKRGGEVLSQIKQEFPKLPVLVLSSYPEEQYAVRLIRAGAAGYLNKQGAPEQLIDAIKEVSEGRKFISHRVTELLVETIADNNDETDDQSLHEKLSDREFHVFLQLALGKPMTQIAESLSLSVKTVATYRARLLEKMKMKSNAELTRYSIRNKLID